MKRILSCILLLAPALAMAQPDGPTPKFLDRQTVVEFSVSAAAIAADAWTTRHYISNGHDNIEVNPVARPLVKSNGGTVLYFSAVAVGELGAMYALRRHRIKHWIPRVMTGLELGWSAWSVASSRR